MSDSTEPGMEMTQGVIQRLEPAEHGQRKAWRRRKRERPGEIQKAACEEFASKGFSAVRMSDIAHRAGVTKGTLYLYFRSKLELFNSLAPADTSHLAGNSKGKGNG